MARSDAERRTALFALTVVDVDSGKWDAALADVDKQYALGEKTGDVAPSDDPFVDNGRFVSPAEARKLLASPAERLFLDAALATR